jgi:hypothetical protein
MRKILFILIALSFLFTGCWSIETGQKVDKLAPGIWRGVFMVGEHNVPVMFKVENTDNDLPTKITFEEENTLLKADSIRFWGDTVFIHFESSKTYLKLRYEVSLMQGHLYDETDKEYPIIFNAQNGIIQRFPDIRKEPTSDLTGVWAMTINAQDTIGSGLLELAVDKNTASGVLLLEGTELKLKGTVQGDKMYLSGFNGKKVCLVSAEITDENVLNKGNLILNDKAFFWTGSRKIGVIK